MDGVSVGAVTAAGPRAELGVTHSKYEGWGAATGGVLQVGSVVTGGVLCGVIDAGVGWLGLDATFKAGRASSEGPAESPEPPGPNRPRNEGSRLALGNAAAAPRGWLGVGWRKEGSGAALCSAGTATSG